MILFLIFGFKFGERLGLFLVFCFFVLIVLIYFLFKEQSLIKILNPQLIKQDLKWNLLALLEDEAKRISIKKIPPISISENNFLNSI